MVHLTIIAHIIAKPDCINMVQSESIKLIEPSLKDAGCIRYEMHQDNENPAYFMFNEIWESHDLWEAHMQTPHLKHYIDVTADATESLVINKMMQIT